MDQQELRDHLKDMIELLTEIYEDEEKLRDVNLTLIPSLYKGDYADTLYIDIRVIYDR